MLFITLALSAILVALIVIALKKHQQQRHKELAERDHSLPPLALATSQQPDNASDSAIVKDWKQECKEHRQAKRFEMALSCAAKAWPQTQAYEQAAITIRAAIKQTQHEDAPESDRWLAALYRTAAEFSFLYDKPPGEPEPNWQTVARSFSRKELSNIPLPWEYIGINELRLLTKTDRKLFTRMWGEPKQHISAKTYSSINSNL